MINTKDKIIEYFSSGIKDTKNFRELSEWDLEDLIDNFELTQ